MAQNSAATDGGASENHPAADLETIVVDPDDIVAAMRRNRRDETEQRSHVLRVTPPLQGERTASLHVSEDHTYYPTDMDPKPLHISPAAFLVGHAAGSRHPDYRNEWSCPTIHEERSLFRDELGAYDEDGEPLPIEGELADEWDEWWATTEEMWGDRVRHALQKTDEITITSQHPGIEETTVAVRFESDDE